MISSCEDQKKKNKCQASGEIYTCGGSMTLQNWNIIFYFFELFQKLPNWTLMISLLTMRVNWELNNWSKNVRDLLVMCIIEDDMSFSFVKYKRVKELFWYSNPDVRNICRPTVISNVRNISRSITASNVWTSYTSEGYISLTAHFIDEKWKLWSKTLCFCNFPLPHSSVELTKKVFSFFKDWRIDNFFSLTLDNASSNVNMQEILKRQLLLQKSLLCNGEILYIWCNAYILNLIVIE